jgi:hypothetical protein
VLEIRRDWGLLAIDLEVLLEHYMKQLPARIVQLYFDSGNGFSEAESLKLFFAYQNANEAVVDVTIPANVCCLRLDPANGACVVYVRSLKWNGKEIPLVAKYLKTNGRQLEEGCYYFPTTDPNMQLEIKRLEKREENRLEARLEVAMLPER